MPKERVNAGLPFDVVVGWQKDCAVQVGVEQAAGFSLLQQLYGDQAVLEGIGMAIIREDFRGLPEVEIGAQVLRIVAESNPSPNAPDGINSIWSTLDRGAVNRLIRFLRRARDAAYGADA